MADKALDAIKVTLRHSEKREFEMEKKIAEQHTVFFIKMMQDRKLMDKVLRDNGELDEIIPQNVCDLDKEISNVNKPVKGSEKDQNAFTRDRKMMNLLLPYFEEMLAQKHDDTSLSIEPFVREM